MVYQDRVVRKEGTMWLRQLISTFASIATIMTYCHLCCVDGGIGDDTVDFVRIAARDGYTSTRHRVVTDDGYILSVFRMTNDKCAEYKRPLLLMHGVLQSADAWLDAGLNASLAYLLVDDCHELWVGNIRGNYYGREHLSFDPDADNAFWEFSIDQLGYYDLAAQIDYVLKETGMARLNYVGFSQGGGTLLMLCSRRVEYNDKVNLFIGLAPATRLTNIDSKLSEIFLRIGAYIFSQWPHNGNAQELFAKGSIAQTVLEELCTMRNGEKIQSDGTKSAMSELCTVLLSLIDAPHANSLSNMTIGNLYKHFPAGMSITMAEHYKQLTYSTSYDSFGTPGKPYPLSKATVKSVILHGLNDHLVTPKDIEWLSNQLTNVVMTKANDDVMWNHADNVYNKDMKTKLYPTVSECFKKYG